MRIRIAFAKTETMRFIGHLDLHRAWERTFRRAGLPLAYSQGFTPHPRLNLASALPLGFTGSAEVLDAWLEQPLSLSEMEAALQRAIPPGLEITQVQEVDLRAKALQTGLKASEFVITFMDSIPDLASRVETILNIAELPRLRRGKTYDLRPLILELEPLTNNEQGRQRLRALFSAQQGATGRPEELIAALGEVPERARIHRVRLIFDDRTI